MSIADYLRVLSYNLRGSGQGGGRRIEPSVPLARVDRLNRAGRLLPAEAFVDEFNFWAAVNRALEADQLSLTQATALTVKWRRVINGAFANNARVRLVLTSGQPAVVKGLLFYRPVPMNVGGGITDFRSFRWSQKRVQFVPTDDNWEPIAVAQGN